MKITRKDWVEYAFWVVVALLFLYERRYLIQKAGLGHFIECVSVRLFLIVGLVYGNIYILIPRFFESKKYVLYFIWLIIAVFIYVALQSTYDIYLYGFVIGLEKDRSFWSVAPYNVVVTIWYLVLTVALHRSMQWVEQAEELTKLYEENKILKEQADTKTPEAPDIQFFISLKTGTKKIKVALDAITYIQGLKDYSIIYTDNEDKIVVRGNLKQMEQLFPEGKLIRIHKSYLVDPQKIEAIDRNKVLLDAIELPLGRSYKDQIITLFDNGK